MATEDIFRGRKERKRDKKKEGRKEGRKDGNAEPVIAAAVCRLVLRGDAVTGLLGRTEIEVSSWLRAMLWLGCTLHHRHVALLCQTNELDWARF